MKFVSTTQKQRWRWRWLALVIGVLMIGAGSGVSPVHAATWDNMLVFGDFPVGAFQNSDGSRSFCLEPGANRPESAQLAAVQVTSLPAYTNSVSYPWGWAGEVATEAASGDVIRQMNWVLKAHGEHADQHHAVAVQLALWELRRSSGNAAWIDATYARVRDYGGAALVDAGFALTQEARASAVGPGKVAPSSGLALSVAGPHGNGTVAYPAGTTELTLEGAVFADGAAIAQIEGGTAGTLEWAALLHDPTWERFSEVSVSGTWALSDTYWPDALVLHPPSKQSEQRLGSGVSPVTGTHSGAFKKTTVSVDNQFAPSITTEVPYRFVSRADAVFADTVTIGVAEGSSPWPTRSSSGEFLPLTAEGTLYGPFTHPQTEQPSAPVGAPVAAVSEIAVDRGPGSYEVETRIAAPESGYYYWVWGISETSQSPEVRASGVLEGRSTVVDNFGVRAEGQIVPTELRWTTQLTEQLLEPGVVSLEDSIRVSLAGGSWLRDEAGERIPATLRFTVYHSSTKPERQADAPEEAREIGQTLLAITDPDVWTLAPPIEFDAVTSGWVTVRTCVLTEDQEEEHRGYTSEWCDDYGIAAETAEIVVPDPPPTESLAQTGLGDSTIALASGAGIVGLGVLLYGFAGLQRRKLS